MLYNCPWNTRASFLLLLLFSHYYIILMCRSYRHYENWIMTFLRQVLRSLLIRKSPFFIYYASTCTDISTYSS